MDSFIALRFFPLFVATFAKRYHAGPTPGMPRFHHLK